MVLRYNVWTRAQLLQKQKLMNTIQDIQRCARYEKEHKQLTKKSVCFIKSSLFLNIVKKKLFCKFPWGQKQ